MAPRSSSPTTPSLMADPIDFTTPQSMPSQLKKAVTTHATQAKAILNNLKQSLSQDSDEQRAEERKKCAKVLKTIKKAKAEKKQAFDKKESMYRAALDFIEKQASGQPAPARANPPPGAALTVRGAALRRRRSCRPSRTRCRRRRRSTSAGTRRAARTPRAS